MHPHKSNISNIELRAIHIKMVLPDKISPTDGDTQSKGIEKLQCRVVIVGM